MGKGGGAGAGGTLKGSRMGDGGNTRVEDCERSWVGGCGSTLMGDCGSTRVGESGDPGDPGVAGNIAWPGESRGESGLKRGTTRGETGGGLGRGSTSSGWVTDGEFTKLRGLGTGLSLLAVSLISPFASWPPCPLLTFFSVSSSSTVMILFRSVILSAKTCSPLDFRFHSEHSLPMACIQASRSLWTEPGSFGCSGGGTRKLQ